MAPRPRFNDPFAAVREKIEDAARKACVALAEEGIPHAIVGGIAYNAFGPPRATRDVDILVPRSAASALAGQRLFGEVEGITTKVGGVDVDFLFTTTDERFLDDALDNPLDVVGVPVIRPEVLIYLKLRVQRRKDVNDIIEMIKAGKINVDTVREYLDDHAEDLRADFDQLVAEADRHSD